MTERDTPALMSLADDVDEVLRGYGHAVLAERVTSVLRALATPAATPAGETMDEIDFGTADEVIAGLDRIIEHNASVAATPPAPDREALVKALGLDSPWPVQSVLRRLADAALHLLTVHDCDTKGWEGIKLAEHEARVIADRVDALALLRTPPTEGR